MKYVVQIVRLLIPVFAGWFLSRQIGLPHSIFVLLLAATAFPAIGTLLLRNSVPVEITWRNVAAGWMLPWGYRIGQGKLWRIAIISGVVWMILAAMGMVLASPNSLSDPTQPGAISSGTINLLLVLAWIVDGIAFSYLLGMLSRNRDYSRPPGSTQLRLLSIVSLLILISLIFWISGRTTIALWIAGFPPLVVGVLICAWWGLIIIAGQNARWN